MYMDRLGRTLVFLGSCIFRTSGFTGMQLCDITALRACATRRILRTYPATAATLLSPYISKYPWMARASTRGVLALVTGSSSSHTSGEATTPVGWTCRDRSSRSLGLRQPPSMAVASVTGLGGTVGEAVQKRASSSTEPTEAKLPVIFVLGGPGSGKGTQCEMLAKEYGYVHLSAGELLRRERESGSNDGQLIDEYIREGRIVPVAITMGLLKKAMRASGPTARFLVDGFPRNSDNRQGWEATMTDVADVRGVLFLHCPEDVLEQRLLSRGKSSGRTDDNAEAAKKRFRTYVETTLPVVKEYEHEGIVTRVNGNQDIHTVFRDIILGLRPVQEKEVLDAHKAAALAASSGDRTAYAELCAPGVTELFGGGLTAASAGVNMAAPASCTRARMLNGGAGVVWCEGGSEGQHETTVWEMNEGRWKCVHRHASPRSLTNDSTERMRHD